VKEAKKQNPGMTENNEVNNDVAQNYRRHGQDSNQVPPEYTVISTFWFELSQSLSQRFLKSVSLYKTT